MKETIDYKLGCKVTVRFLTYDLDDKCNLIETLNTVLF